MILCPVHFCQNELTSSVSTTRGSGLGQHATRMDRQINGQMHTHTFSHNHMAHNTHSYSYTHTYMHAHTQTLSHTFSLSHTLMHIHIHELILKYSRNTLIHSYTHTCTHTRTRTHSHTHPHTHSYTHTPLVHRLYSSSPVSLPLVQQSSFMEKLLAGC